MIIEVNNLSKSYSGKPPRNTAGGLFANYALKDISFGAEKGECIGIIGLNGSGKSSLLKILSGVTAPTVGSCQVKGKISALLELGAGFNPEYTGISNIYLNGMIHGLSKHETRALIPQILDFSELGEHINERIKTYSDGMFLRLAFSCAIAVNPDVLIIDEALAVGDFAFRQKCFKKIDAMKAQGVTILMVSHDIDIIRHFCTRTLWLDSGHLRADGDTASVTAAYMESVTGCSDEISLSLTHNISNCSNRFGSAIGSVKAVKFESALITGGPLNIKVNLDIPYGVSLDNLALSVSFKNSLGLDLTVISTADNNIKFKKHGSQTITICSVCHLNPGRYSLAVSLENRGTVPITYYDYADGIAVFDVASDKEYFGIFHTDCTISID